MEIGKIQKMVKALWESIIGVDGVFSEKPIPDTKVNHPVLGKLNSGVSQQVGHRNWSNGRKAQTSRLNGSFMILVQSTSS